MVFATKRENHKSVRWILWKALQSGRALFRWEDYYIVIEKRKEFDYAQGKTDTETNFIVNVGLTTKVEHQTISKIW